MSTRHDRNTGGHSGQAVYLYGIVSNDERCPDALPNKGVDERPVRLLPKEKVSAVVSPLEGVADRRPRGAGLVRLLRAHSGVLSEIASLRTVLPAGFNVHLDEEELGRWMAGNAERLEAELDRLGGCVELKVRISYIEEAIVQEIVSERPHLQTESSRAKSMEARVAFGKRIAAAIEERAQQEGRILRKRLAPLAREMTPHQPGDGELLATSFLVRRDEVARFDRALRETDRARGHCLRIACVGPLPPYSFVKPLLETGGNHGITKSDHRTGNRSGRRTALDRRNRAAGSRAGVLRSG